VIASTTDRVFVNENRVEVTTLVAADFVGLSSHSLKEMH
jgi:hypothetical protein